MHKIDGFQGRSVTIERFTRPLYVSETSGPPVLILHEIIGMRTALVDFARMIADAGFRVYLPVLFGSTKPSSGVSGQIRGIAQFGCVAHQFRLFAQSQSGPWAEWFRKLADLACEETDFDGAGAIGLCLTGNFALAAAVNPKVKATVMGEPSLPFAGNGLHLSVKELDELKSRADLDVRAYRYSTDIFCRAGHFSRFQTALGDAFTGETIQATERLHCVFTEHLLDKEGNHRHDKVEEVIVFLKDKLAR